ncbi:MAG: FHA domain-containing protein [Clostridium sp.]|nr:FHA domain-containing protein [Clostridium sp.]MCM1171262.1 FHA domain-containing protein [Clostridium sp.]MCM1207468.1 FHA domain-containing protein [Ruminococcus sp.]
MNLKRCDNGHFYDVDKYASCPHCQGMSAGGDDDMGATMKFTQSGTQQGVTIPATAAFTENTSYGDDRTWGQMSETIPASESYTAPSSVESLVKTVPGNMFPINPIEEDDSVTQRFYPNDMKTEPVVGWLVCISGEDAGTDFALKSGRNFIGRSTSMDVVLAGDKSVSREKHAILLYEPRKREFLAQPGDSRELFYVNDEVVLNTEKLNAYDKLLIGNTELLFVPFCGEKFAWEDVEEKEQ